MAEIFHFFNIKSTNVAAIYEALTTEKGLAGWWTTGVKANPKINSVAEFRFSPNYHNKMLVTKLVQDQLVEWECTFGDPEWIGTIIKFEIISKNDSTNLKFYHSNWKEKTDFYGMCNYHWGLYLKSLKSFIEEGKGTPHFFE